MEKKMTEKKMTDEKKVRDAAMECGRAQGQEVACFVADGFRRGAEWAQREFLSHLWHGASEEPQGYNKWVIIKYDNHPYISTYQVKKNEHWENLTKGCPSFHWLYLDDLLPEEGGAE